MKTAKQRQDRTDKYRFFTLSKNNQTCRTPWCILMVWVEMNEAEAYSMQTGSTEEWLESAPPPLYFIQSPISDDEPLYLPLCSLHPEMFKARLGGALSNVVPVQGVPAYSRGVGTRGSLMSLPTQALLWVSHKGKNTTRRTQEQVDVSWQPLKYNFKPYKSGLNLYSESMSLKLTLNAGFFLYACSSQLKSHFIILSFLYLHLIKDEKWCDV